MDAAQPFPLGLNITADPTHQLLRANRLLNYENTHDKLTGLLTKEVWKADIEKRLTSNETFGIVFIDFDKFKRVNDVLGHEVADDLLHRFGVFLPANFRREGDALTHETLVTPPPPGSAGDTLVGRYGGDEIGVTFSLGVDGEHRLGTPLERLEREVAYIKSKTQEFVDGQPQNIKDLSFNMSVGAALWEPSMGPMSVTTLIRQADEAMHIDKQAQRPDYSPEQQRAIESARSQLAEEGLTFRDVS
jgi:GGDEF domain-containing protein